MRWGGRLLSVFAAAFAFGAALFVPGPALAQGATTGALFDPATASVPYTGTEPDGTAVTFTLQLDVARLTGSEIAGQASAPPGEAYFDVEIGGAAQSIGTPQFRPDSPIPATDLTLSTPQGNFPVDNAAARPFGQNLFAYDTYFLVPDTIASATLNITAASNVGGLDVTNGDYTYVSFNPLNVPYAIERSSSKAGAEPSPSATPTSVAAPARSSGTSNGTLAVELVGTAGGVTFFVILLPILVNRRSYARATEEGTVVIGAPPTPDPPPPATEAETEAQPQPQDETPASPKYAETVFVRLFGEHDGVEGLRAPIGQGPREVLDFLVAHPGTERSSARLRAAIWCDPET